MFSFNLAFAIAVSRARGNLVVPFFQIIYQSWRIFFLRLPASEVHTCTCAIPLNMQWECARWNSTLFFFFFNYGFCICSHASRSLPPSFFFEKVWTFQVKDVIFEDYTASASWKETCRVCRYLQYFFKIFVEIVSLFFIREKSWYNIWKIYINRLNYEKWSKILWTYNIFLRDSYYRNNILFQDIYAIFNADVGILFCLCLLNTFVRLLVLSIIKKLKIARERRELPLDIVYRLFQVVEKNCAHKRKSKYLWNAWAVKRIKSDSFSTLVIVA